MFKNIFENLILILVIISQLLSILYIITFILLKKNPSSALVKTLGENGFVIAFIVSIVSTLGSLIYSDILGYEPCKFCWFQRIFMYPQVLLLGIAIWRKEWNIYFYSLTMSIIGGILALNHYILQTTGTSILPCSAVGYSASCSKVFVMHLGYITVPLMAFSGFLLMSLSILFWKKSKNNNLISN